MKLNGKRVLITGGSSGIGFAISQALLAKGARVAVTGRRSAASRPLWTSYARLVDWSLGSPRTSIFWHRSS